MSYLHIGIERSFPNCGYTKFEKDFIFVDNNSVKLNWKEDKCRWREEFGRSLSWAL